MLQTRRRRLALVVLVAGAATLAHLGGMSSFVAPPGANQAGADGSAVARRQGILAAVAGGLFAAVENEAVQARSGVLPPINKANKYRCQWFNSKMGQANAARDKVQDLRECDMRGTSPAGFDIAGALMGDGNFAGVNFQATTMSKVIAEGANFEGASFQDAVADRVVFNGANLKDARFNNAVLIGATFEGADLTNADFSDSYIEQFAVKPLCENPTLKGTNPTTGADTWESAQCMIKGIR